MQLLLQALALVSEPPGSFVYFALALFALEAAFATALGMARRDQSAEAARVAIAAGVSFALRLLLLLLVGLAALELLNDGALLPPVDRGITVATIVLLGWGLAVRPPTRSADAALIAVLLVVFIATVVSLILWFPAGQRGDEFNGSINAQIWWALQLAAALAAMGLLAWRRNTDWALGATLFLLLAAAAGAQLVQSIAVEGLSGHVAGFTRLAEASALPLFAALAVRQALQSARAEMRAPAHSARLQSEKTDSMVATTIELEAARALSEIGTANDLDQTVQNITEGVARALRADIALLWAPMGAEDTVTCVGGYDLIQESHFAGFAARREELGAVASSIIRAKPGNFRLPVHTTDLHELGARIGLTQAGPAISAPMTRDGEPYGAIMVFSPYSQKEWDSEARKLLAALAESVARALIALEARLRIGADLTTAREQARSAEADARGAREFAERVTADLQAAREQSERDRVQLESLTALMQDQPNWNSAPDDMQQLVEELRKQLETLQQERDDLQAALEVQTPVDDGNRERAERAEAEVEHLRGELAAIQQELEAVSAAFDGDLADLNALARIGSMDEQSMDAVVAIAQDIRQPMSSVVGYTELLLGEQAGIIGALQRQFLERIKSSAERVQMLLDDLVRISTLDASAIEVGSSRVDVTGVLEEAITSGSAQFRDKGIVLRMDIDENLPHMRADRDSLYLIMQHLLNNAALASRPDGEVEIMARADAGGAPDGSILFIAVRDSGEGIPPEDQGRVFSRVYRSDNPLIQGVGDTGIGLSVAKTLVEAHGGRIWVESEPGVGSTFNVLFPAVAISENGARPAE